MKIGVVLLSWNGAMDGETPTSRDIVDLALLAEETGFDSVWINDHFYFDYSDFGEVDIEFPAEMQGVKGGAWECWSLVSAIAQATTRVEIGTLISSTSFRNPALLARIADTADDLSEGRLILGLGAGDLPTEHVSFGFPFDRQIARFEEAVEIISRLIRGESVTFDGEFYRVQDAALIPKSVRPKGPPLLIGSVHGRPRMNRLTLTYGDYWNCFLAFGESTIDQYRKRWTTLVEAAEQHGRDPSTIGRNLSVSVDIADTPFPIPGPTAISGAPDAVADTLLEFASEGIEHCTIVLHPFTRDGIERLGKIAERVRSA